ncbi:hypothetical protein SKAU_G00393730 [Synaphobranchus kaupii]|uniref:BTB domain-containing protein n=1 Tax=Synaphobranchus kaupii TaxID=118154 RepID=A0A9Q1ID15_SYNKA|nr:hypothetical protein SKAU_G00393730 [Synaphobranchus kaupii]
MSGSRKEFDVKQILRIRWRWFGHPTSPPPHSQALGDFFSGRGTGCAADSPSVSGCASSSNASGGGSSSSCSSNSRKFLESASHAASLSASVSACPRSFSQQDCRSPPALPWVSTSPHPPEVLELTSEGGAPSQQKNSEGPEAEELGQEGNNVDSDSSSCRTSNSSQTLSSCNTMEACGPEELFQALSHAEHTFRRMESYLRHKQLCDVVLLVGERRIPAHRLVLSSVSDYFAAMFTSDVREAKQEEVKMEGVDPDALWALVQ